MSYLGIITSMVVQEHPWHRALCEPLGPDGLTSLLQRLLESNQARMCPHSSATTCPAWFGVQWPPLIIHKDNLRQPKPTCCWDISLCMPRSVCPVHGSYLSPVLWGLLCGWHRRHCTAWTGQHSKERIHPRKTTLSRIKKKKKALGKKAHENQLVIFPSARSPEVFI